MRYSEKIRLEYFINTMWALSFAIIGILTIWLVAKLELFIIQ
jgi:hypothetical protein